MAIQFRSLHTHLNLLKAVLLLSLTALAACSNDASSSSKFDNLEPTDIVVTSDFRLKQTQSCEDLSAFIIKSYTEQFLISASSKLDKFDRHEVTAAPTDDTSKPSPSFTGTNNHEADADETDFVKVRNKFTFVLNHNKLAVVETHKEKLNLITSLPLSDFTRNTSQYFKDPAAASKYYYSHKKNLDDKFHEDLVGNVQDDPYFEDQTPFAKRIAERVEPRGLAIEGDRLYVILDFSMRPTLRQVFPNPGIVGNDSERNKIEIKGLRSGNRILTVDIKDPAKPKVIRIDDYRGSVKESRSVQDGSFLVSYSHDSFLSYVYDGNFREVNKELAKLYKSYHFEEFEKGDDDIPVKRGSLDRELEDFHAKSRTIIRKALSDKINAQTVKKFLPEVVSWQPNFASYKQKKIATCADIYNVGLANNADMTTIIGLPKSSDNEPSAVGIFTSVHTVYSNGTSLYLAQIFYESYHWWRGGDSTIIHKFSFLPNQRKVAYQASGKVAGFINNQFSMSEFNGYLRLVSTIPENQVPVETLVVKKGQRSVPTNRSSEREKTTLKPDRMVENTTLTEFSAKPSILSTFVHKDSSNTLYILSQNGNSLDTISKIDNLATGEKIYSARFIADRAFVVTYRRVDPLFTFDLSDPKNPKSLGQLKIPGFSTYIHPLDENFLLTIGISERDELKERNAQIQVFDISDMSNPKRLAVQNIGNHAEHSIPAIYDSHAFTFDPNSGILSLPLAHYSHDQKTAQRLPFYGFFFYQIRPHANETKDIIKHVGSVDHMQFFAPAYCKTNTETWKMHANECEGLAFQFKSKFYRSFIHPNSNFIYAVSEPIMTATPIEKPNHVTSSVKL